MNLQINVLEVPGLATIISVAGVIFAGIGLFFTAKSFRQNTKSQYVQMLKEFHVEITSLESSQERNYDYDLFAAKYLNLHDRIAYLVIMTSHRNHNVHPSLKSRCAKRGNR